MRNVGQDKLLHFLTRQYIRKQRSGGDDVGRWENGEEGTEKESKLIINTERSRGMEE